jgi:hypothetical protein
MPFVIPKEPAFCHSDGALATEESGLNQSAAFPRMRVYGLPIIRRICGMLE